MELHSTRFFEGDDHGGDAWQPLFLYYAPPLVHTPFQAPDEYIARCGGFDGYDDDDADAAVRKDTRAYCAMIVMFDESLANVSCAVDRLGWQDDTLLVVMTDNGGANNQISGSNFPLSGGKGNIWNGGMLGNAFISSPRLVPRGSGESHYVFAALAHMVDWLPTLMHAATDGAWDGTPLSGNALDGFDLWDAILGAVDASSALLPSPRTELAMMSDDSATLLYSDDGGVTLWKLNRDDSDPDYDRVLYPTYEVGSHEYTCSGVGVDDDHGAGDAVDDDDDDDDDDGHGPPPPGGGYDDDEGGSYGGGRQPRPCQPGGGYGYGGYGGGYGSKHYGSGGYGGGYGTGGYGGGYGSGDYGSGYGSKHYGSGGYGGGYGTGGYGGEYGSGDYGSGYGSKHYGSGDYGGGYGSGGYGDKYGSGGYGGGYGSGGYGDEYGSGNHGGDYGASYGSDCVDSSGTATDLHGHDCAVYALQPLWCGQYDDNDFRSNEMCCGCLGGDNGYGSGGYGQDYGGGYGGGGQWGSGGYGDHDGSDRYGYGGNRYGHLDSDGYGDGCVVHR